MPSMAKQPLVSVVVPVYGIERYVGQCVESLLKQTYRNLDIVLVDDGSPDKCGEICDLYARKDSRVRVVHQPNGGLVSARKAGLRLAAGEYVSCVDGDDWVAPGFVDALCAAAVETRADAVCAGQTRDLFSKSASFANALPCGVYEGSALHALWRSMLSHGDFYHPGISTYVWNKLFRREVLAAPQFAVDDRISMAEDGAVTYPTLLESSRVTVIDNADYHYRQREDSMLKQNVSFAEDARKLRWLHDYMMRWAAGTPPDLHLADQIADYVLSIAIIRSGGRLPDDDFSTFDPAYYGKDVAIYSAGTFGQQLANRFAETGHCRVVAWLDDDFWEYRRCGLDVDPVENVSGVSFDFILVATVDSRVAKASADRLAALGVPRGKILTVGVPPDRRALLDRFLAVADNTAAKESPA